MDKVSRAQHPQTTPVPYPGPTVPGRLFVCVGTHLDSLPAQKVLARRIANVITFRSVLG